MHIFDVENVIMKDPKEHPKDGGYFGDETRIFKKEY